MSVKGNNIEIIDLDPDETEQNTNTTGKYVNTRQVLHTLTPQKTNEFFVLSNSTDLLQDKNIGSTTDTTTSQNINLSKCLDSKTGKTLALIPIDCLKYCDMKDGKFRVKLNTLNKIQGNNAVYLYNVPEGNDLQKKSPCIQKVENIPKEYIDIPKLVKIGSPKISNVISLDRGLGKISAPEVIISPKNQFSLNPIEQSNIVHNHNLSLSHTKLSVGKVNRCYESVNSPFLTSVNNKNDSKKVTSINKRNIPSKGRPRVLSTVKSNDQTLFPFSSQQHAENYKANSRCVKSTHKQIEKQNREINNTSIDLTGEKDSLAIAPNIKQSLKESSDQNIYPFSLVPRIHQKNSNKSVEGKTSSKNLSDLVTEKVYFISRNPFTFKVNSDTDSATDVSKCTDSCKDNDVECDPLGDLPNIFEPIVTLNEPDVAQNTLENTLTEGLRGSGIPKEKMQELEIMIQKNNITSPFKVMIPSKYLNYCTKKNGKYLVDLNALKRINREKKETMVQDNCLISNNPLNNMLDEAYKLDEKKKICNPKTTPKSVVVNFMYPEQCRYYYMKSSAWDKVDPESTICKGFNEREIIISKLCLEKYLMYLANTKRDKQELRTDSFIAKTDELLVISDNTDTNVNNSFSDSTYNELYFTKKIDILDKIGRRVRTEHVAYNKRSAPDDRDNYKKQKLNNSTEYMLSKMRKCSIVIERNDIVEGRVRWKLEQQKIRKRLNSKFIKTSTSLNRDISRPTILLNKYNIHIIRLDEKFCTKCNVMFVKNYEDDFPESLYKNTLFINLVEKKLIRLTSPSVLQDYFTLKDVIWKF